MTMFREGGPGSPVSMRRVLAAFFALAAVVLGLRAIPAEAWAAYIPCGGCLLASCLMLFFTTWGEVAEAVAKAKG